ncbi:MAG: hypothetical protein RJA70_1358 [Pseudomonadota bacterium]|jgi:type VI secretion system secreted protein Hcp
MKTSRLMQAFKTAALTLMIATSAHAGAFIKFDGIDGEVTDRDHKNWSEISSFSQAIHAPGVSSATGASRRAGLAKFDALTIARELDKASPRLAEAVAKGSIFPTVTLELTRRSGEGSLTFYKVLLKNARVTSYQLNGQADGVPSEQLQITFESVTVTYTSYADGAGKAGRGDKVEFSWDVAGGKE